MSANHDRNAASDIPPPDPSVSAPRVRTIRAYNPAEVLQMVPRLLGFHPEESIVVIGTAGPNGAIRTTVRYDLSDPPNRDVAEEQARPTLSVLMADRCDRFIAIGYGPGRLVPPSPQ